jgi:predicted  nucleic acid-binding Zn-ribbon protein
MTIFRTTTKALHALVLMLAICTISFSSCNPPGEGDLQQEHANTYLTKDELAGYEAWAKEQESYTKAHQDLIHQVENRMERLEEKMSKLSPVNQAKAREEIKHLELQKVSLKNELNELSLADEKNWAEAKQAVDRAADSLRFSMEKLDKNVEWGGI